jgi:hypothetical protein
VSGELIKSFTVVALQISAEVITAVIVLLNLQQLLLLLLQRRIFHDHADLLVGLFNLLSEYFFDSRVLLLLVVLSSGRGSLCPSQCLLSHQLS